MVSLTGIFDGIFDGICDGKCAANGQQASPAITATSQAHAPPKSSFHATGDSNYIGVSAKQNVRVSIAVPSAVIMNTSMLSASNMDSVMFSASNMNSGMVTKMQALASKRGKRRKIQAESLNPGEPGKGE